MTIQSYPQELAYVNAKLSDEPGDFLGHFLNACLRADEENYELLRLPLAVLRSRYPASAKRMQAENDDLPY